MQTFIRYKIALLFLLSVFFSSSIEAQKIPGEYIVQLNSGFSRASIWDDNRNENRPEISLLSTAFSIYKLVFDETIYSNSQIQKTLSNNPAIRYFTQNAKVRERMIPNDEHYDKQWDMVRIAMEDAWNVSTGGTTALGDEIVVAILDSGYDVELRELTNNIFRNRDEKNGDFNKDGCPGDCGVDDDNDGLVDEDANGYEPGDLFYNPQYAADDDENGYIDDILGVNLIKRTDEHAAKNHGTAVAGIIGARGNNQIGVTGVNWRVKMMLISEASQVDKIIEGYNYIYEKRKLYNETNGEKGAYIVVSNFSSGIDNVQAEDFPIWCGIYDKLGSVGVLNVGATTNKETDVDIEGDMPSTCPSEYLIIVTNMNESDFRVSSGYGQEHVDLGAPGTGTLTLGLGQLDNIGEFSGTSSAAPHVAGAIALLHSIPCEAFAQYYKDNPGNVNEIIEYVLNGVDPIESMKFETSSGGRLNVFNVMKALRSFCPGSSGDLKITQVHPNPSYREILDIQFESNEDESKLTISVFDALGKHILSNSLTPPLYGEKHYHLEMPELSAGLYYIVMRSESELVSWKQVILPHGG